MNGTPLEVAIIGILNEPRAASADPVGGVALGVQVDLDRHRFTKEADNVKGHSCGSGFVICPATRVHRGPCTRVGHLSRKRVERAKKRGRVSCAARA